MYFLKEYWRVLRLRKKPTGAECKTIVKVSALGMLATRPGREISQTWQCLLSDRTDTDIQNRFEQLGGEMTTALNAEGYADDRGLTQPDLPDFHGNRCKSDIVGAKFSAFPHPSSPRRQP